MEKNRYQIWIIFVCLLLIGSLLIMFLGGSLNQFVVYKNNGKMPVKTILIPLKYDATHSAYLNKENVKLWWATDIFHGFKSIYSLGDVVVWFGVFWFYLFLIYGIIVLSILAYKKKNEKNI